MANILPAGDTEDAGSIPGSGRSPGVEKGFYTVSQWGVGRNEPQLPTAVIGSLT